VRKKSNIYPAATPSYLLSIDAQAAEAETDPIRAAAAGGPTTTRTPSSPSWTPETPAAGREPRSSSAVITPEQFPLRPPARRPAVVSAELTPASEWVETAD